MDKEYLLTEQIKWHENAIQLLQRSGFNSTSTFGNLTLEQRKQLKDYFKELAKTCFTENILFQEYASGEKLIYSPYVGTFYFKDDITIAALITFIEDTYVSYYKKLPDWKLFQIFFNFESNFRIILNNGFPKLELNNKFAVVTAPWNNYDVAPVSKNLKRLRHQIKIYFDSPSLTAFSKFKGINYGILNKSVNNIINNSDMLITETEMEELICRTAQR